MKCQKNNPIKANYLWFENQQSNRRHYLIALVCDNLMVCFGHIVMYGSVRQVSDTCSYLADLKPLF
jgi:hypothetical protein